LRKNFPAPELTRLLGVRPLSWARIESAGYGRVSAHWRVQLEDGRSLFVKQALTTEAGVWLRGERLVYEHVRGEFMPTYYGTYDGDACVVLVLEDLGAAEWPPPWSGERLDSVLASLAGLRDTAPPAGLGLLDDMRDTIAGWPRVRDDPEPLLSTGACSRDWLERALPALLQAAAEAELGGADLMHLDVRSDNLCFKDGAAILIDWNHACIGNGLFDIAFWLPSLRLEGGPHPWELLADAGALPAVVAGFFAARVGMPPPAGAPTVREFQLRQLEIALLWAARELGLPPPTETGHAQP
jgi:hypothetical protein